MPPHLTGVGFALGAAVTWAIANVYIQRAARENGDLRAMLWAQVAGVALLLPVLWLTRDGVRMPPLRDLFLTGAASALGYYGMLRGFRQAPLSVATPIVGSWALPAALAGMVWQGERPTAVHALGGALVIVGAAASGALAHGGEWRGPKADALFWASAGSVGFGVMATGVAVLARDLGNVAVVPVVWAAQWVMLAPLLIANRGALRFPAHWGAVLAMAGLEALGFVLYSLATSNAPVSVVSPPASLATLFTVLFAAAFLGEKIGAVRWALIVLIVIGTALLAS